MGTAGLAYFEAAQLSEKLGRNGGKYLQAAYQICDCAVRVQDGNGRFAKCWHEDGSVAIREGVAGSGQGQRLVSFHLAVYPYLSFRPVLHTGADRL